MTTTTEASHKVGSNGSTPPPVDQQPPPPEVEDVPFKPDDDQVALYLVPKLRGKIAFFHSSWKAYESGVWKRRDVPDLRRYIRKELRVLRSKEVRVSQHRIKSLTAMLEDDLSISDRMLIDVQEEQRRYVNLRNGMFNLETMQFEPRHNPKLYFTTQLDFDYDEDATCPSFRQFLATSLVLPGTDDPDPTLIRLLIEGLAYSMTARTDLKASFWLVGMKDSGKSTFVSLLRAIFGSLHATIDLNQLGTNRFLLAGIVGKRVVTFTEASGSSVLPDALYKTLVGGTDEVYADVKNRDPITFRPEAKIWWGMNEMPRVTDRSGATVRRIVFIPFNRTIPEKQRIANLEHLLMAERSGIFNEMVNHYWRVIRAKGFERCEQSEDMRRQYILENDTEVTFIEECADCGEGYKVHSRDLYQRYQGWCEENGFKPKNRNQVAAEWRRLGFSNYKTDGLIVWRGLRLKT